MKNCCQFQSGLNRTCSDCGEPLNGASLLPSEAPADQCGVSDCTNKIARVTHPRSCLIFSQTLAYEYCWTHCCFIDAFSMYVDQVMSSEIRNHVSL